MFVTIPNVHDARLVGYDVDGESRKISFRLRPEGQFDQCLTLEFAGVFAHSFKHVNAVSIMGRIYEIDCADLVSKEWGPLAEGMRSDGWPEELPASPEAAQDFLKTRGQRAFVIESAIGISGWLLALTWHFSPEIIDPTSSV